MWEHFHGALESELTRTVWKQRQVRGQGGQSAYVYRGVNMYNRSISSKVIQRPGPHGTAGAGLRALGRYCRRSRRQGVKGGDWKTGIKSRLRKDGWEAGSTEMAWGRWGNKGTEVPGSSMILLKDWVTEQDGGLDDCGQRVSSVASGFGRQAGAVRRSPWAWPWWLMWGRGQG